MVERYRTVENVPYGGTVALQEISTGNIFTRYHIARDSVGAYKLTLDTNAAGYNASYHNSEVVVPYTDIFSIFTVEGEALEIPYLLLLKGVVKKEEERTFRQMMVAVDVASLAFGVAELKLAFTATSNLAKAFRIALGSADIMATAADVACNGEDNELCQDWQKVSGWVQLGLISATGADVLYQTLKKSPKLQDEVLRLGGIEDFGSLGKIGDNLINSVSGDIRKFSGYALTNPQKTGLFVDSWGYQLSDAEELLEIYRNQAIRALTDGKLIANGIDDFGNQLYKVETILNTPLKGEIKVYAGWIIKPNAVDELILSTPFDGFVK